MPDVDILKSRIAMLAASNVMCDAQGRRIVPTGNDCTQAFLDEVAQTQLQRRLAFENQRGDVLSLIAKAGRVIAVSHETTTTLIDMPANGVIAADRDVMVPLVKVVTAFLQGCTGLTVVSHFVDTALPAYDVGLDLAQVMRSQSVMSTGADTFADRVTQIAFASVVIGVACEHSANGDATQCDILVTALEAQSLADDGVDRCLILGCDTSQAHAMVIASQGDMQVGAIVAHDAITDVLALWATTMGAT